MEDLDCLVQLYDTMAIMDYLAAETTRPALRDKADSIFYGSKSLEPVSIQSEI